KKGYFIAGKFDQLQGNVPYVPFIQAFGHLMRKIIIEGDEKLAAWREKLRLALGQSGAVITEVIPEVELIMGPQPPVEALQPQEAQNRFRMAFRDFIRVFAAREHPLVIFLDDLQWADPASLRLIRHLAEDTGNRCLLLIGAYRDNEITGTHPLGAM
ncbi:ATP-binding protein, partial [Desulfocucumis palustris]|uniref:ATP-binding protein n=1 Tax=Desulfocucumis palustris TaxID=1898651 RepID=UPI001056F0BF